MVKRHPYFRVRCGTVADGGYGATIMCREDNIRRSRAFCRNCPKRRD